MLFFYEYELGHGHLVWNNTRFTFTLVDEPTEGLKDIMKKRIVKEKDQKFGQSDFSKTPYGKKVDIFVTFFKVLH